MKLVGIFFYIKAFKKQFTDGSLLMKKENIISKLSNVCTEKSSMSAHK